ncbi:MAG: DUF4234 domain-containing protein [Peptoniphilus harei]|nr:DUF4234 domain-containing protein [Peptoniphilus harei]
MMGFSSFLYFLFSLPFLGGMAISLVFMTFSLFSIFKNWNTGKNKELFNGLLISGIFLLITNIFLFIISKIFYYGGFYGNFYLVIVALIVIGLIYFIGNSKERIYPDNYFSNISDVEFLKRELNNTINVLMSVFDKSKSEFQERSEAKKAQKFESYKNQNAYNNEHNGNSFSNNYNYSSSYNSYSNYGRNLGPAPFRGYVKDDWSFPLYILLCFITCGFYQLYFVYKISDSINIVCDGDGEETSGLMKFFFLGIITCNIYCLFWEFNVMNRIQSNAPRYNRYTQDNGSSFLLWLLIGSIFCGLGIFVAWYIFIKNLNLICKAYNMEYANAN